MRSLIALSSVEIVASLVALVLILLVYKRDIKSRKVELALCVIPEIVVLVR